MLSKHGKYLKRPPNGTSRKTIMSKMKKISDRINGRLDIIEEKFSDCEFTTIKVSKMKCREKD